MKKEYPVFFDPQHKRWLLFKILFYILILITLFLSLILFLSILIKPSLQTLNLSSSELLRHSIHQPLSKPTSFFKKDTTYNELKKEIEREKNAYQIIVNHHNNDQHTLSFGFFVNWDDSSFTSLKRNLNNLDVVIPEWLHTKDEFGSISEDNPTLNLQVTSYILNHKSTIFLMPLINNYNGKDWEGEKIGKILDNVHAQQKLIDNLFLYVSNHNFKGLSIDFEMIPVREQSNFVHFISILSERLHQAGLLLSVNAPADDSTWQYKNIAQFVDYEILMMYDDYSPSDQQGPIAGLGWFSDTIKKRAQEIVKEKMVIALGNYAYDWKIVKNHDSAIEKTFEDSILTAKDFDGQINLDRLSLNSKYYYYDEENKLHLVWMLDAISFFNQSVVLEPYQPVGIGIWRLGSEDPTLWNFFGKKKNLIQQDADTIEKVDYGYDLNYEGKGEILRVTSLPQDGFRNIQYDSIRGLIISESYKKFPTPYTIHRYGYKDHQIALTFDDGPDAVYTTQILDILKKFNVHATFFVVGQNVAAHLNLLKREFDEGNEIGNHTFTHPNISTISPFQLHLELSATERLIESTINRQSLLFRPPYAEDAEPDTPDQMEALVQVNQAGYIPVGMQIDPSDWQRPGVQNIINKVISDIEAGKGNILLLHDSGGDRTQTVAALPNLITKLRSHGYKIVTVSELLGKKQIDVMPFLTPESMIERVANHFSFSMIHFFILSLSIFFLLGILLGITRLVFLGILSVIEWNNKNNKKYNSQFNPNVAIIIAAFNEEKVILKTIYSLLSSKYSKPFEVIIVDDGSTDSTFMQVYENFYNNSNIHIYQKLNGGKPSALNFGIEQTKADIIITLDADTIFTENTIHNLVRHFSDLCIGAIAGNAKVGNRVNILTNWQAIEYITGQNLDRRAFSLLNCITVVPGAVGAWRREAVIKAGGFMHDTLAEDADLTLRIRKLGYVITYEHEAIGLTEAPETIGDFIKQRYRWMYGTLQIAWKHKDTLFSPRYGFLGLIAIPNVLIFQVLFPLLSPLMDLIMFISIILTLLNRYYHPLQFSADSFYHILFFYALFLFVDYIAGFLAFMMEPKENMFLLLWLFWQRFFYRQLLYYVAIKSFISSLKGGYVGWNKLERKGTVNTDMIHDQG